VRYFLLIPVLALLSACAAPQMSQAQQEVRPISNTDDCAFVKTAYFEVSHPSKLHYYATQNVIDAGGDSYNIITTGNDTAVGLGIHTVNIGIYKCTP